MHQKSRKLGGWAPLAHGALLALFAVGFAGTARGAEGLVPFTGEKSSWHGFDRYDFLMDEQTLNVRPAAKGGKGGAKGQRPCIVVVPKTVAAGNPWSWQACYWDHEPQTEVELLKRGFHIAFVAPDGGVEGRDKAWDAWYKFLTEKHGLAKRAAFVGMSKGGVNEYSWGGVNPEKVACIYADNPALWDEDFARLPALAKHDVPLLHVCGSEDFLVNRYTRFVEDTYHSLGGQITVIIKDGHAHHRHSLQNPNPIADWIEQHRTPSTANKPAFVDGTYTKAYYYSLEPKFIYLKEENSYATARGPGFTECYDRYDSPTSGKFKMGGFSIVVPKTVAHGKPWVLTGDPIERDATVEQALLAKGYHILIISPTGSGFTQKQWDDAYKLLVDNGFSSKPVLKGIGPKAGEAYAWAIANPDKVSCIYARNPLMKSLMAGKQQPIDNLAALAKAGVPVLHDCGAMDPWLDSQTRVVEKRYKELGGKITVIVRTGEGHFPLSPKDPKSVVDFIGKNAPIPVNGDAPMSLYGGGAARADDCLKRQAGDSFRWTGSGQITWKVLVDRAGDYEVALSHAAEPGAVGRHLQVSSGDSRVEYTLALTKGVFGNKSYEMTPIKGRLRLEAGTQTITLGIPDAPKAMVVLAFRSLELIPVAANAAIEAERREAQRARASTEWLAKAGYGLMFHWTSQSVGKDGTHKPYAQAVDDFDVKRFADMVAETGAGYVIFTIGHAESYCPAPLKAWEKYHPGKTTGRDLIAEMADALSAKGIKLMCYLNAASLAKYPKAGAEEFSRIMTEVVTEFGEHYKEKLAGYWIDCCYQAKEKYPGFSFREFFKTCKVGNPNRIVALNSWIYPNVSEWQEYWAGETASPVGLPLKGTTQEHGPGAGLRYHALLIMEPYWVQQKAEMPRPRFTAQELGDYIDRCKANGGAVTINLGIYQDGTVDPDAVNVLKEAHKRLRETSAPVQGQSPPGAFAGERTDWHGFDRYDFLMDENTLAIKSADAQAKGAVKGQRRCIVVVPKAAALGKPWSWRGCYWDHQPQAEIELLRRGFHIAYVTADANLKPDKIWEAWYAFLTEKHGLSKKPAFIGMSRGGEYSYTWATEHPGKVACIYADNPGVNPTILKKLGDLAAADVPILEVCGSIDPLLARSAGTIETIYQQYGGRISVMIQEGKGHHPHSLRDPKPIADFIARSVDPAPGTPPPAYLSGRIGKSSFYSLENAYRYFPQEGNHITCRGSWFTDCYDRYSFELKGVQGAITVILPRKPAPGKPWTFRADHVSRDATMDLALLARGFHIVTGPVPFNGDGPSLEHWNAVYKLLTEHGFSKKPVLEGAGGAAGEAYAWAIANPDKVSCIYAENPVLRCTMTKAQPLDNLAVLAKAGIPMVHVCGSLDPMLQSQTRAAEARCKELGAAMTVIVQEDVGHYPTSPKDPTPVVDFILRQQQAKPAKAKSAGEKVSGGLVQPTTKSVTTNHSPLTSAGVTKALGRSQSGTGQYFQVDYPPSTVAGELAIAATYTVWIPDGAKHLRGVIVHQHGAGTTASIEGGTAAYDLHWQALAKKWDCALLGPSYHVLHDQNDISPGGSELWFDPRRGSEKAFVKALGALAKVSAHAELENVPWVLWGHSGGGIWADVLSTLHPERVVAMWLRSGSAAQFRTHPEFVRPQVPSACHAIPIMVNPGVKEEPTFKKNPKGLEKGPWWGNLATFQEYREHGALIGLAADPRTGHECGDSRYLAIPYLEACMALRLPTPGSPDQALKPMDTSQAWLATLFGTEVVPAAQYRGDIKESVWLPNEAVAKAWLEYTRTGAVGDATPPPAPTNVRAWPQGAKGELGTEIVWNAEADFESGIKNFVILRDGQELAKVPRNPVGRFGRPLFQSMTYHDTPAQPLPEMRYMDTSAKTGSKHTYEVITVNSVGLKSASSVKATAYPRINAATSYQVDMSWPKRPPSISWGPMSGVAVDSQDNVWVLSRNDPPVQIYRPDGTFVRAWGEGLLDTPHQLKLDSQGNVWLADSGSHVVLQCTPQGKVLRTLGTRGEPGCDERHFNRPADMVITPAGDVFVADGYGNVRVVHFDKYGKFVKSWGKLGAAPGEFSLPHAIALDSRGRLYVADRNNVRIQVFDQDGRFLDQWPNVVVPCAFWMTRDDELWVCGSSPMTWRAGDKVLGYPPADQLFMRFDTSGKLLQLWAARKGEDGKERPGDLNWVHGLAVDSKGNIYAVDIKGQRAQKFVRQGSTP